jgi:transposase
MSIPGIGVTLGSTILGELGDINRFQTDDELLAFCGLDPSVYQSGDKNTSYKPSKRGSSYLRWAIHRASSQVVRFTKVFKEYYEKKKKEGKHYLVIMGHVGKKLLRVIRSLLINNTIFNQTH